MRKIPAAASVLAAVLALACDYDPRGRCASQRDCLAGQVCAGGVCQAEGPLPVNQPPIAASDSYQVTADTALIVSAASGLLANDSDPDGDPLTAQKASEATHGLAFVSPDGSLHYQPQIGFTGTDSFTYRATDGALWSDITLVTIAVVP